MWLADRKTGDTSQPMTPCIDAQGAAGQEHLADKVYPVRLVGNECIINQECFLDTWDTSDWIKSIKCPEI